MKFRRQQRMVSVSYCLFAALWLLVVLFAVVQRLPLGRFILIGLLLSLAVSALNTFSFFSSGFLDVIELDGRGITITQRRLSGKKHTEFVPWKEVTGIDAVSGYSGKSLMLLMKNWGKYNSSSSEDYLLLGWSRKIEEYICVNHPEIPFVPVKFRKK